MIDPTVIPSHLIQSFLYSYLPHRDVLRDFYELLPETKYDYRLVDTTTRKSDTPRESLAHIIETRLMYLHGVKTGKLTFEPVGVSLRGSSKSELLNAWDRHEDEMMAILKNPGFDAEAMVDCPWGQLSAQHTLFLIRDHEILHCGWNLALMDALGMERYPSLQNYWG